MKKVLELIERREQKPVQQPFWQLIQDKSIDRQKPLTWFLVTMHTASGFADLCKLFCLNQCRVNQLQKLITQHTDEDQHHCMWCVEDIKKLQFNQIYSC
ncbi:MAG TPA: hypothetical protein VK184_13285 [Nostocaceae cyanobacterium]|nr:hypothetical protein [Nostocaceae cyanobacterium]